MPTICSETCVGRIRYLGIVLYDADRVEVAASTPDEQDLLDAQLDVFLDPNDPAVREQARRDGIPEDWLDAAVRSPVWKLAMDWRIALPLHPEYRTMPMVWYIPPLSPVMSLVEGVGGDGIPWPTPTTSSPRSTTCGSRSSTWRTCSPPGTRTSCAACSSAWRRCAAHMRRANLGEEPDPRSPRRSA